MKANKLELANSVAITCANQRDFEFKGNGRKILSFDRYLRDKVSPSLLKAIKDDNIGLDVMENYLFLISVFYHPQFIMVSKLKSEKQKKAR